MNRNTLIAVGLALILALPVVSVAQRGGGGGQGRAGGQMMRRGNSQTFLVNRADVQKDIKFTAAQKNKLDALRQKQQEDRQAMFQDMQNGGDRQAMMEKFQKLQEEADKEIMAILTDTQKKRLKEISIQLAGPRAVMQEEIAKELKLTGAQKKKIDDLMQAQGQANQEIFAKMRNGEIEQEEVRSLMEKNNKALEAEINKVLTADQKNQLEKMKGAEFKADPNEQNRGFGGGRQGGGRGTGGGGGGGFGRTGGGSGL